MSSEKTLNAIKIIDRVKQVFGIETDTELANLLNLGVSTVSSWRRRESVNLEEIVSFCKKKGGEEGINVNMNWVLYGEGEKLVDEVSSVTGKIMMMLEDMTESEQREILKSIKKEKLLEKLMEEEEQKRA